MLFMSIAAITGMTSPDGDQTSDADKVVVFSGHSVVKGPKSFSETNDKSNDNEE